MQSFISEILPKLKLILSPQPIGVMDADFDVCYQHLQNLTQYITNNKQILSNLAMETGDNITKFFYSIFEIVDYFGLKKRVIRFQLETYLFSREFISIFGILYSYHLLNESGTRVFHHQFNILDDRYFLYQDLLPNLFSETDSLCSLANTFPELMAVNVGICKYNSALTRIIVSCESQVKNEKQTNHLIKSMEFVLRCLSEYLTKIDKKTINESLKLTISELIYRIELLSYLCNDLKSFIEPLVPFVLPIERNKQIGRTQLRIAVISAEINLRKILNALRCFQFSKIIDLCEMLLLKLEIYSFYKSNHDGVGEMCFTGFSENFNQIADEILQYFERLCLLSFHGSIEAAEIIMKVFINFYNLPAKKGWSGPWIGLNERTINVINSLAALNKSDTFSNLFNQ